MERTAQLGELSDLLTGVVQVSTTPSNLVGHWDVRVSRSTEQARTVGVFEGMAAYTTPSIRRLGALRGQVSCRVNPRSLSTTVTVSTRRVP